MLRVKVALVLSFIWSASLLCAQGNSEAAHVRSLNNNLLQLHGQLQAANASQGASLRSLASAVIAERFAALQSLIALDPSEALQLAFDDNLLAGLAAAFPGSVSRCAHLAYSGWVDRPTIFASSISPRFIPA